MLSKIYIYKVVSRIPEISRSYEIPFWGTDPTSIEGLFKILNNSEQRFHSFRVYKHGCDFPQNIFKVAHRIPGIPGNYKIPCASTVSVP